MDVNDGLDSGLQQKGTWTVPVASGPPTVGSVTPSSGSGSSQTLSFVYSDPRGYAAIKYVYVDVANSYLNGVGSCYLLYFPNANALYLANDAFTVWLGPVPLGMTGTLQNSQCSIDAGSSSAPGNNTNLTVNLAFSFNTVFGGTKNVYMDVNDGLDSGLQQKGTWTVIP